MIYFGNDLVPYSEYLVKKRDMENKIRNIDDEEWRDRTNCPDGFETAFELIAYGDYFRGGHAVIHNEVYDRAGHIVKASIDNASSKRIQEGLARAMGTTLVGASKATILVPLVATLGDAICQDGLEKFAVGVDGLVFEPLTSWFDSVVPLPPSQDTEYFNPDGIAPIDDWTPAVGPGMDNNGRPPIP